jgi:isocitrate dehydrogenase
VANLIENAWKKTLEDGVHTTDIYNEKISSKKVGTKEFAEEVVTRLGQKPTNLKIANYSSFSKKSDKNFTYEINTLEKKSLVGVDIFVDMNVNSAHDVANKINPIDAGCMILKTISSKGLKLWPREDSFFMNSDHWCCRFMPDSGEISHEDITNLLNKLVIAKIDFIKVENLYNFDGKPGYSLAQGE